jgi:hypothetical protein
MKGGACMKPASSFFIGLGMFIGVLSDPLSFPSLIVCTMDGMGIHGDQLISMGTGRKMVLWMCF